MSKDECLDTYLSIVGEKLILYPCSKEGGNQFFAFTKFGQIITSNEQCVGVNNRTVVLVQCSEDEKYQLWSYNLEVCKTDSSITYLFNR